MINARFMYLRPGNLFKDFVVESNTQVVTASGRVANAPKGDGSKIIRGCLAESTKEQKECDYGKSQGRKCPGFSIYLGRRSDARNLQGKG
nr:MAG TPA: hypothetical protein [Caudoviricetes sp.]